MREIFLFFLAVIPAIILCIYIYKKDSAEKEPVRLLMKLFVVGALITVPVSIIENFTVPAIDKIFEPFGTGSGDTLVFSMPVYVIYQLVYNIFGIALAEEGFKWLAIRFCVNDNPNFNCLFDGVIYAVFVSLGFACLENILYVFSGETFLDGVSIAWARFFTSVPGHMFFSVSMGYCMSMWQIFDLAGLCEESYVFHGIIVRKGQPFSGREWKRKSIIMPTLIHGIWDFLCSDAVPGILLILFVVLLYIFCFWRITDLSKRDRYNKSIALGMTIGKYPELREFFKARAEQQATTASVISGDYFKGTSDQ